MQKYAVGFGVGISFCILIGLITLGGETPTMERLAQLGDALAPVGSILTAAALLFAFEQHRATQVQAHNDRLAAGVLSAMTMAVLAAGCDLGEDCCTDSGRYTSLLGPHECGALTCTDGEVCVMRSTGPRTMKTMRTGSTR